MNTTKPLPRWRVEELLSHLNECRCDNVDNSVLLDNIRAMQELLVVKNAIQEAESQGKLMDLDWIYPILP